MASLTGVSLTSSDVNLAGTTSAEVTRACDLSAKIVSVGGTALTITLALHDQRIVLLDHTDAASTCTLPAATGTGAKFTFIVSAVNTNDHVIQVANATDVFEGTALMCADGGNTLVAFESGASDDTITLNGTTTGGAAIGDKIEIIDYASGKFQVIAHLSGSGTEATPFSAAVS